MQQSSPAIRSFERLQPTDGLLITTEHWQRTQDYHRQRQNFHYQSLYQAGIVRGLGVAVTAAPPTVEARYRDDRWIQVHPGIAIDAHGNPIVVTEPCVFQVQSNCQGDEPMTVYIVANYVDPDELRHPPGQAWVRETFRIVEKTTLNRLDVELCRIRLVPGDRALLSAVDVLAPGGNQLDLTHRCRVRDRPEGVVRVVQVQEAGLPEPTHGGLTYLLRAVRGLYPDVGVEVEPRLLTPPDLSRPDWHDRDLLYLPHRLLEHPQLTAGGTLREYVQRGGLVLIAAAERNERQEELAQIRRELAAAMTEAETDASVAAIAGSIQTEIAAIDAEVTQYVQSLQQSIMDWTQRLGMSLSGTGELALEHPLRTTPFLFGAWPTVTAQPTQVFCWGGIILLIGNLASAWGPDPARQRSRETIRAAHELGINLLYYAWRRRQLWQLQTLESPDPTLETASDSLTGQVTV